MCNIVAENLIVFDWDDTLFPTSHLISEWDGCPHKKPLNRLENQVLDLLLLACQYATVKVVSNANAKWLTVALGLFPRVKRIVELGFVEVISARSTHSTTPCNVAKTPVFHRLFKDQCYKRFVSIGDGLPESVSAHVMKATYDVDVTICAISERLTLDQLCNVVTGLTTSLPSIFNAEIDYPVSLPKVTVVAPPTTGIDGFSKEINGIRSRLQGICGLLQKAPIPSIPPLKETVLECFLLGNKLLGFATKCHVMDLEGDQEEFQKTQQDLLMRFFQTGDFLVEFIFKLAIENDLVYKWFVQSKVVKLLADLMTIVGTSCLAFLEGPPESDSESECEDSDE
eukprot:Platyproteum_vivax@DN6121_c0_g1_i2.p1